MTMPFDDFTLRARILIGVFGPPSVTIICWLAAPLWARARHRQTRALNWTEFWLLLLAAYLVFAIALAGGPLFTGNDNVDPSSQLVR
jgi:heme/copper-type cytochrome/quinol oxidase subunit 1